MLSAAGTRRRPQAGLAEPVAASGLPSHTVAPAMLADLSPAGLRVYRIIQEHSDLLDSMIRLGRQWRAETLIHGDLKFDNVLVVPDAPDSARDGCTTRLVDWEFVQIGDPAWDLASVLHDFLLLWTSSMPLQPDLSVEQMIDQARRPLEFLRPAIRAFWEGYLLTAGLHHDEADSLLLSAVTFSAVRLVLAAHELSYELDELPVQVVLLVQLAANLLADPESACTSSTGSSGSPHRDDHPARRPDRDC